MTNEVIAHNQQPNFMAQATETFEGIQKLAELMANCGTLPKHLQGKPADCFRVVAQAAKWGMDPFGVAECTSVVHGRLCFEGKLVAAVLKSMQAIEGNLDYEIKGEGQKAQITVTGVPKGSKKPKSLGGSVDKWRTVTKKDGKIIPNAWDKQPEEMLIYRGTRQWARLYAPEAILGVYTPDELQEAEPVDVSKDAVVRDVPKKPETVADYQPHTEQQEQPTEKIVKAKVAEKQDPADWNEEVKRLGKLLIQKHSKLAEVKEQVEQYGVSESSQFNEEQAKDFCKWANDLIASLKKKGGAA